ncbi:flavoprotein [Virgibacillus ihumii]|uniref:flavoprotein n=1 Tax=Virgibacillus ihumii TaxID=2686091 RepID=UPI001FEB6415|nr:flavoprotein [Virgibacillus ihumii]
MNSFREFINHYMNSWRSSSLVEMEKVISKDFHAREIRDGEATDYGYEQSVTGWEQGFHYAIESGSEWDLHELAVFPLHNAEMMAIISASMIIDGRKTTNANLFFNTFRKNEDNGWKLVRSYIEAGVPTENLNKVQINL